MKNLKLNNGLDYLQSQHAEEFEREARQLRKYDRSIREIPPKIELMETLFYSKRETSRSIQKAIEAIEKYQEMRTRI